MAAIESAKEILTSIHQTLQTAACMSGAKVVLGYPKEPIPNPLKKALAAVNLHHVHTVQDKEYTNGIKTVNYTYIVDLYVPTAHTGSGCMALLVDISDVLLSQNNGETQRTSEVSSVQYDSNGRAFHAQLTLTLIYDKDSAFTQLKEGTAKVYVIVNQIPVAYSQKVLVKAQKNTYDICVYGERKPVDTVILSHKYTISINRLIHTAAEVDLRQLKNFNVLVKVGTRQTLYTNCNWAEIEESIENQNYSYEKAVIYSSTEKTTEEGADD